MALALIVGAAPIATAQIEPEPPLPIAPVPGSTTPLTPPQGATQNLGDPAHAYDPGTGQTYFWDPDKNSWVDGKTGEPAQSPTPRDLFLRRQLMAIEKDIDAAIANCDKRLFDASIRALIVLSNSARSRVSITRHAADAQVYSNEELEASAAHLESDLALIEQVLANERSRFPAKCGKKAETPPSTTGGNRQEPPKQTGMIVPRSGAGCAGVYAELNAARSDPAGYARTLSAGPGTAATREAVAFLESQAPEPPLTADARLEAAAARHAADQGPAGLTGHVGTDGSTVRDRVQSAGVYSMIVAEDISVGQDTAGGIVRQLIIDEGSPTRMHRADVFNPLFKFAGAAGGPNKVYHSMCVLDLSGTVMPR